jgi:hypothetical protein
MAITNELSSEIAAALLTKQKSPRDLERLREVMLQIHTTLQKMQEYTSLQTSQPHTQTAKKSEEELPFPN